MFINSFLYSSDIMDNQKLIRPLTETELTKVQSEQPGVTERTISHEDLARYDAILNETKREEEQFPILKPTEESIHLSAAQINLTGENLRFINTLEYTPVKAAIQDWLTNLNAGTRRNYAYYMTDMMRRNIIHDTDVGHFRLMPHEQVIDYIKKIEGWSEGTKQVYAACYISFTGHLERISGGWFRKAIPNSLASNPTFFQIREKCKTEALTISEWNKFIDALAEINKRDSLIARSLLQGAKRISEAISITLDQIDWDKNIIRFRQSKTGGMIKEIPITYPKYFMDELKIYIDSTADKRKDSSVFITRNGKQVTRLRLNYSFAEASKKAGLKRNDKPLKVTPHVLRATWVTLVRQNGASDSQIMQVTGHQNNKMVIAYDKTSDEQNISKTQILI